MKENFDINNWEIIYAFEGRSRGHGPHPYDKKGHNHITGSVFARKKNLRKKLIYRYTYNIRLPFIELN